MALGGLNVLRVDGIDEIRSTSRLAAPHREYVLMPDKGRYAWDPESVEADDGVLILAIDSEAGRFKLWEVEGGVGEHALIEHTDVEITPSSLESGDIIVWDGVSWINQPPELDVLLSPTNLEPGDILVWDGVNWVNEALDLSHGIGEHTDVIITPSDLDVGDIIIWDGDNWINGQLDLSHSISEHTDVVITPSTFDVGDILVWDGVNWVNDQPLASEDGPGFMPQWSGDVNDVFRGNGTFGQVPIEIQWGFAGTISTDQNVNIERYRSRNEVIFRSFDVNVVSAGVGGDTVIAFKKYDFLLDTTTTVASVTLEAGERRSDPVEIEITLAIDDEIWPEVQSVAPTEPPVTMTMSARS